MSKTKSVKPLTIPTKGTFLKPGVKTETFLHSIGQDAESVGVVANIEESREAANTPAETPAQEKALGVTKKSKKSSASKKSPSVPVENTAPAKDKVAKPKEEAISANDSEGALPANRRNTLVIPNLTTDEYLDLRAALAEYSGTQQDAYRKMISFFVEEVKKEVSEEDFAHSRRKEERKLLVKAKKQESEREEGEKKKGN